MTTSQTVILLRIINKRPRGLDSEVYEVYYAKPRLLLIDEVGYLCYSNRHADLLFEIINRRYEKNATIVTTNRPFSEWNEVFPNAACVVSLIDRLVHHSEVLAIEGESYRMKEAQEQASNRRKAKIENRKGKNTKNHHTLNNGTS